MHADTYDIGEAWPPRTVTTAFLGLGSNLGDREHNLRTALQRLRETGMVVAVSSLYETQFVGVCEESQPPFLNCVARVATDLSPMELLLVALGIEALAGRRPTSGWQPRTLDIDVLLYSDVTMRTETLTIPHPRMWGRAFVLKPLAELCPRLASPDGKPVEEVAMDLIRRGQQVSRIGVPRWLQTIQGSDRRTCE